MSGFEVVGITLGAIPLVINALEHYREGLGRFKGFRETEANAKHILVDLYFQEAILHNTISTLYREAGIPPEWVNKTDPEAQQEIDEKLRAYLGQDYKFFLQALREIEKGLQVALQAFQTTSQDLGSAALDGASEARLLKKTRWALRNRQSDKKATELLEKVSSRNQHLGNLLQNIVVSKTRIGTISDTAQAFAEVVVSYDPNDDDGASIDTMLISVRSFGNTSNYH